MVIFINKLQFVKQNWMRVSLKEINDTAPESAEQDQPPRMCTVILLYSLRNINRGQERLEKCLINMAHTFLPITFRDILLN